MRGLADLREAIDHGAVKRVRPEDHDRRDHHRRPAAHHVEPRRRRRRDEAHRGADGRRRRDSVLMELAVYPAIYFLWRRRALPRHT